MQKGFISIGLIVLLLVLSAGWGMYFLSGKNTSKVVEPREIPLEIEASPTPRPEADRPLDETLAPPETEVSSTSEEEIVLTPTQTPTPKPISRATVYLFKSQSSLGEQAKGTVGISLLKTDSHYSGDPDYKVLSFKFNVNLENLQNDHRYALKVCWQSEINCTELADFKTDSKGNVYYGGDRGATYYSKDPIKSLKIVSNQGGECSSVGNPCMKGDYSPTF
ncbi:MAG: hypothetical protein Q7S88_02015 [Candidatus Daviesbacteria bacterium]|nr:hypothetical protein [Candidatus Daviesbacteria bacterium]